MTLLKKINTFKDLMEWYGDDVISNEEQRMYCVYGMFTPFILSSMTKDIMRQFRLEYISFPEIQRTNKVKRVNKDGWIQSVFTTQLKSRRDTVSNNGLQTILHSLTYIYSCAFLLQIRNCPTVYTYKAKYQSRGLTKSVTSNSSSSVEPYLKRKDLIVKLNYYERKNRKLEEAIKKVVYMSQ